MTETVAKPKYEITADIVGLSSAYVFAPFDEAKEALESNGYDVISFAQNAPLRISGGKDSFVSQNGNRVREAVVLIPSKGKFLTKNSPIMQNPVESTNCHRRGVEFYLTGEQVDYALANSVNLCSDDKNEILIPTKRFGDDKRTVFMFDGSKPAQSYGDFLKDEAGIKEMPIWTPNLTAKPYARHLWFSFLVGRSYVYGNYNGYLHNASRMRGVRVSTSCASANAKKSEPQIEAYTPMDIQRVLIAKGLIGIEQIVLDGLRNK